VRSARHTRRLSQRDLATLIGVKPSHIAYIENGRRRPSIALLVKLAEALSLDKSEMLFLAYPDSTELTAESRSVGSPWKQFTAGGVLLELYNVSPVELRVLKQISTLGEVSHSRQYVLILNAIRLASSEP
jgi:transcriptional regulator with XRE-family HTH domain